MRLQELLGGEGVDVVWMCVREPGLLTADYSLLTQQLWRLKVGLRCARGMGPRGRIAA
jgi:hypothetical protein